MNNELVNRIENGNLQGLFYNTACLKVNPGNDFNTVYQEFLQFAKQTVVENGCIEFFTAPGDLTEGEIMLWEVWENEASMNNHMDEPHTKDLLAKNLITFQWAKSADLSVK